MLLDWNSYEFYIRPHKTEYVEKSQMWRSASIYGKEMIKQQRKT
jgi:hypothetical protein